MSLQRYGVVRDGPRPREVVLLQAMPCSYGKCKFCDYRTDNVHSTAAAMKANDKVIRQICGSRGVLQVICSGSWLELPFATMQLLRQKCWDVGIKYLILEGHWLFHKDIAMTRQFFEEKAPWDAITCEFILGLESTVLERRIALGKPLQEIELLIAKGWGFNWANLMHGDSHSLPNEHFFFEDVKKCSEVFDWVNISIFTDNPVASSHGIYRSEAEIQRFYADGWMDMCKKLGNVFVFDYGDSRAPDTLGGVGNTI